MAEPGTPYLAEVEPVVAFIDNVTFHPVPEPSTIGPVGIGLAALAIAHLRMM